MFSLQRLLSLGYLQQHWRRALLALVGIAVGVAAMVATRTLSRHLNKAAQAAVNPLSGFADLIVFNGQPGVPRDAVNKIDPRKQQTPDPTLSAVHSVDPMVVGRVFLPSLNNRSVLLLGLEPPTEAQAGRAGVTGVGAHAGVQSEIAENLEQYHKDFGLEITRLAAVTDLQIAAARLLGTVPVVVSARLAEDLGLTPEDSDSITLKKAIIPVRMAGIQKQALVVATVRSTSEQSRLEPNVVVMQVQSAAEFVYPERPEYVTQINVSLKSPVSSAERDQVKRRLQELVGVPLKVQTVDEANETVRDVTAGLELGFSIGGTLGLVVGLFLVFIVLSVSVAERRHEIGILRSVGATRTQVGGLFVFEAMVLGLTGSLLGLPIGYGLARVAQGPITRVLNDSLLPMDQLTLEIDSWTLGLALAAGLATTVVAALLPAVLAAKEEPATVVRRAPTAHPLLYRILHVGLCLLLLLAGMAAVVWREALPLRVGVFYGIVCILLAALIATPLLAMVAGKLLQPFFRLFLGLEGRLAADNLVRSPGRTGIVIAALAATGALFVQTAGFIKSSEEAIISWLDESIAADVFVTGGSPLTKPGDTMPMDESVREQLLSVPRVDVALGVRFHALPYRNRLVVMLALDTHAFDKAEDHYSLARNLTHFPRLREPGTALVSRNFAALYKVKVGDHVQIDGLDGPLSLEVIGTVVDYTWNRGTIMVDRDWFKKTFRDHQVDVFDVYLRPEDGKPTTEEERQALLGTLKSQLGDKDSLHGVTRGNLRSEVATQLRRVYGLAYAQQSVVGIVALLGVITALLISVLQRRRELGLLRAVGASQEQVLRSVLAEAVLMGLVGAILGLATGLVLEWYVIDVVLLDEAGFDFPMRLPWQEAGVVFGLSVVLATVVGLWPAYQATRIRIAEAIAYE